MGFLKWTVNELHQKSEQLREEQKQTQEDIEFWRDANKWFDKRIQQERDAQKGAS